MSGINYKLRDLESIKGVLLFATILFFSYSLLFAHDGNDYDIKIYGSITAQTDSTIDVDGVTFFITDDTEIKDRHGDPISFSDLQTGDAVEIKGVVTDFGFTATRIKLEDEPEHEGGLETTGFIETLGDDFLVVNGLTFFVNDETEIKEHDQNIEFENLSTDDFVEVKAEFQDDSTFLATRIKIEGDHGGNDEDFETEGIIESLGDSSLVVNGITFAVDENTIIVDDDNPISFEDLDEEDFVEIKAITLSDSSYLATKIKREEDDGEHDDEFETEGLIESLGDSSLVVNGVHFIVNENTEIKDDDNPISFGDLKVGDFVEIHAINLSDSSYLATKIKRENNGGEHDGEFETEGLIESLGDSSLVVNGVHFIVNENTKIKDEDIQISFGDLNVGDFVEVKAHIQEDSTFLATKIKREDDHDNEFEIEGFIDSKDSSSLVVSGITFNVNNQTEILDHEKNPITFDDLMIGMRVEVHAIIQSDSSLLATKIKIQDDNNAHIEITAPIDTIYNSTVVVGDIEFLTDSNTVILDEDHNSIALSDLEVGMLVEVRGVKTTDGRYYATRIKIEELWSSVIEFEGVLISISETMGQVGDREFFIDASTLIINEFGDTVDVSYLQVEMNVEVRAVAQNDNNLLATRIKVEDSDSPIILGSVNNITGNSLSIGNFNVNVNDYTFITDLTNQESNFNDLKTGLLVKVKVAQQSNGTYEASRVRVLNNPNVVKSTGTVITIGSDLIVVSQLAYQLNSSTEILNSSYNPIDYNDIHPEDQVTVWTDISTIGDPLALQIKISNDAVTNTDDGVNEPVSEFTLSQNYPNPFNPATTIRFTLPEASLVSIKVYNLIGEEVATLVNNTLTGGSHSVVFNAANLASGVYLYRIQTNLSGSKTGNVFTQTKKMILLK
jgi:molybdopterin converting factor small subunit